MSLRDPPEYEKMWDEFSSYIVIEGAKWHWKPDTPPKMKEMCKKYLAWSKARTEELNRYGFQ